MDKKDKKWIDAWVEEKVAFWDGRVECLACGAYTTRRDGVIDGGVMYCNKECSEYAQT